MYCKDLNRKLSLRLSDDMFNWLTDFGNSLGMSPSEIIRMIITSVMVKSDEVNKVLNEHM